MTYNAKTNWKPNDPVTEDDFNRIEQGIKDAHTLADEGGTGLEEHEAKRNNPHHVNKIQVGLGNVENYGIATQEEAEAGETNEKYMTPLRTKEAIEKLTPEGISEQDVDDKITAHAEETDVHGLNDTSLEIGYKAQATGTDSTALGREAQATGFTSTALGREARATGASSTALGRGARATNVGALAIGVSTYASGDSATAVGYLANAVNHNLGVLGGADETRTNAWLVPGSFTVNGTKNFEMPHPHPDKRDTHRLRHSAVESPTAGDNLYRFSIEANQDNETVELELPDYFRYLNKNVDVWVNGVDHFGNAYGKVEGNTLKVNCEYAGKYNVLVIGTRNDDHQSVQNWDIKGVEREVGESWTGETYVFEVDEILEVKEIKEEDIV